MEYVICIIEGQHHGVVDEQINGSSGVSLTGHFVICHLSFLISQ
jgi:hypothetical protein